MSIPTACVEPIGHFVWSEGMFRTDSPDKTRALLVLPQHRWIVVRRDGLDALPAWIDPASPAHLRIASHQKKMLGLVVALVDAGFLEPLDQRAVRLRGAVWRKRPGQRWIEKPDPERSLISLVVRISNRCNLSCPYCSSPVEQRRGPELLPMAAAQRIATELGASRRRFWVTVTGGEPFAAPHLLDVLPMFRSVVAGLGIATNGTLIDSPALASHLAKLVDGIVISIDGPTAEEHDRYRGHGTFDKSIRAVRLLKEAGAAVALRSVRTPGLRIEAMEQLAAKLDVRLFVNPLIPVGRGAAFDQSRQEPRRLTLAEIDRDVLGRAIAADPRPEAFLGAVQRLVHNSSGGCPGVRYMLSIETDGSIFPCSPCGNPEFAQRFRIGNIWDSIDPYIIERGSAVARMFMRDQSQIPQCRECFARHECTLHCYALGFGQADLAERCKQFQDRTSRIVWRFDARLSPEQNMRNMYGDIPLRPG